MSNIVQWYGGKGNLYKKILPYLHTKHKTYVEAYAGGASVFLHKRPSPVEVLNDVDKELINLYRVLQDRDKFDELKHRLDYTLYSRAEFERALNIIQSDVGDDVTRAWAFFVGQNQGFSGKDCRQQSVGNWSRSFVRNQPEYFANKVDELQEIAKRFRNAYIDCVDALECIRYWDSAETLFYLDPPYISDTRVTTKGVYQHETDNEHHKSLVELLLKIKGQVVLSGYHHEIYEPLLQSGWRKVEFDVDCSAAGRIRASALQGKGSAYRNAPRTEVLYVHIKDDNLFTQI